jgi:5-oxoprolinase (ATP-hydrolysing)
LTDCEPSLEDCFIALEEQARELVRAEGISDPQVLVRRSLELRYLGTDWPLTIDATHTTDYSGAFVRQHQQLYGYVHHGREIEVVALRAEASGHCGWSLPRSLRQKGRSCPVEQTRSVIVDGVAVQASCFARSRLQPGDRIVGPALIIQETSTTCVDPGWSAELLTEGELLLTDHATPAAAGTSTQSDPILLEIFNGHFEAIARQMGITLRNTSCSVNVKQRLDFSCALFARDGSLVVNAPHIPVHLGSMSETVRHLLCDHTDLRPGDVLITNDPFRGGSHLPDVTVVTPVFGGQPPELRFLVASRAHHAEIGGITPGSMPAFSRNLAEEGVLIRSFKLIDQGQSRLDYLDRLLREAAYPSRDVQSNLADIRAQVAANQQGVHDLQRLVVRYGWPVVAAYMQHIQRVAETKVRQALTARPQGTCSFVDRLDEGAEIRVEIHIQNGRARIDFTGSSDVLPNNLNANLAIVTAAVMYTLRCLIDEPIPLNQGMLSPVDLIVPPGMLNPPAADRPEECPAVAGGNVETSQRLVDVLLGALGLAAASQGTMNNLLFGSSVFGYYETICGGAGATAHGPGADAVHTHMTNTRLTDPEVLEHNYPLRVRQFAIRRGSGGRGLHCGGCGVIRELEFLAPLEVSVLSQRRGPYPPYGMAGGEPGQRGENRLRRVGQSEQPLGGCAHVFVQPGDILTIATPGGGGYGRAAE